MKTMPRRYLKRYRFSIVMFDRDGRPTAIIQAARFVRALEQPT